MEGVLGVQHARASGGGAGDLDRRLHGLGAAVGRDHRRDAAGRPRESCSASTPLSSVTPSWGRLPVRAAITSSIAAIASGWLRPIANTP